MKLCPKCEKLKNESDFPKDKSRKDGLYPYCKTCNSSRVVDWQNENPEKHKESARLWARDHYDREKARTWQQANKRKVSDYSLKHIFRKRVENFVEDVDRNVVWERDKGICHICRKKADPNDWQLDHIHPVSKGGEHSYKNTAVSHSSCNHKKNARLMEDLCQEFS